MKIHVFVPNLGVPVLCREIRHGGAQFLSLTECALLLGWRALDIGEP
jgi:hypothetical protein